MHNVKRIRSTEVPMQPTVSAGLSRFDVLSVSDRYVYVQQPDDTKIYEAIRAASCLLEPTCGDQVLVHFDGSDQPAYVIAVLARADQSHERSFKLSDSVVLVTSVNHLQINAQSFGISSEQGDFKIDRLNGTYRHVTEQADSVSLVANEATHKVGRFVSRLRDSFRLIEGLDRTQASNIDQTALYQISMSADITKVSAQHVVKVQAKKIDLG
ncbi:MAG TPA: DUF3540 domain-containing protein [Orrella sp.]